MNKMPSPSVEKLITTNIARNARRAEINVERKRVAALGYSLDRIDVVKRTAKRKIFYMVLAHLAIAGIPYRWRDRHTSRWFRMKKNIADYEPLMNAVYWQNADKHRILTYNLVVSQVNNNVDLCLFNATPKTLDEKDPKSYIALGELKGGIDPAGADEHWKTAKSALERIRKAFARAKQTPHTFFIGAAIEKKMASEIWDELQQGTLSNAANLNEDNQVASISNWLCNL